MRSRAQLGTTLVALDDAANPFLDFIKQLVVAYRDDESHELRGGDPRGMALEQHGHPVSGRPLLLGNSDSDDLIEPAA